MEEGHRGKESRKCKEKRMPGERMTNKKAGDWRGKNHSWGKGNKKKKKKYGTTSYTVEKRGFPASADG